MAPATADPPLFHNNNIIIHTNNKVFMKKNLLILIALVTGISTASAIDDNTVEIVYSGTSATVSIASNISSYITNNSSGSHVSLVQSSTFAGVDATADNEDGEIIYVLSGSSSDGEFYLEGSYKCVVQVNGLTLTNPSGPAINIQNGKRIDLSIKKGTTNTITDGANDDYNGCYHCKGHTKFKGKGTLNVIGNSKHAIYSKEYIEVKNATINVTSAVKDGFHCKEYFYQESGTITISGVDDDGIQVELDGTTSTGTTTDHDDEDSGNFYQDDGSLTISSYGGKAIKADGTITLNGTYSGFTSSNTEVSAGISEVASGNSQTVQTYDLSGRKTNSQKGILIVKQGDKVIKKFVK